MRVAIIPEEERELSAHPDPVPQAQTVPSIGELVSGKYCVDGTAGTGGMGVVLSARHVELGHRVAIKVLAREQQTDDRAVERFMREGKAAASLQSDHVVRIYDVGRLESGAPFMVMELLRGEDLGTYVGSHGPVEPAQAVDWILQACNAIAEAHAHGIVHRDLKPANLFLTQRSDGSDCVKVLDFGISKQLAPASVPDFESNLTATRQVVGSPAYMSPEQVRNSREIDHRVDIWALGMTLYEFLSGRPAFCADTFPAVCAAIVADAPVPLHELATNVPKPLSDVVIKCLEKNPNNRFASVSELVAALTPFAPMRPASAGRSRQLLPARPKLEYEPKSATLASAPSPKDVRHSGSRGIDGSERNWPNQTLVSDGQRPPSPQTSRHVLLARIVNKRSIWLMLGVVGFAAGVIWKLEKRPAQTPAAGPSAQAPLAVRFAIRFESEPSGAKVWEDDALLGTTPLEYTIARASVRNGPRTFSVRADGYVPFTIKQGDSNRDVVVMARLALQPAATAALPAGPSPHGPGRSTRSNTGSARTPAPQAKPADTLPNDIRMQR